ncbi:MAG TPA: iron-sulfur cluster assembly scaffold protein [Chloroflexi bacterium]|nr:iron-sulfur cluster assembly scaffold protein [Chloroflexota bacterium]
MEYSLLVMDHFLNPRNVGDVEGADGVGMARNLQDGDTVRLSIRVVDDRIEEAKFKAQGCVAAIAASSMLTELIEGRSLDEALAITKEDLVQSLGGLPERKARCSLTGPEALREAIEDYRRQSGVALVRR